jgi:IrrE N-terminal-like domain
MPLAVSPDWCAWSDLLAQAEDIDELDAALAEVAAEMRCYLGPSELSHRQWRRLGIRTVAAVLAASGGCRREGRELIVFVNGRDDPRRQRFTVAHEVAHLLLDEARGRLRLTRAVEEQLCDRFAAELLVPAAAMAAEVDSRGDRLNPSDVVDLGNRFGVNLQPILIAIRDHLAADQVLLVAREAGHPKRPAVVDYRFHTAAARTIYLPRHQRLRSVGLRSLANWACGRRERVSSGSDSGRFELRQAQPRLSGVARGEVAWSARLLPNGLLLASLDTSAMAFRWRGEPAAAAA